MSDPERPEGSEGDEPIVDEITESLLAEFDDHLPEYRPEIPEFRDMFTTKVVLGAFFVAFVMTPGSIYLSLLAGRGLDSAAQWTTVILFLEISRRAYTRMTKQEVYLIYYMAGSLAGGGAFGSLLRNQFLITSPIAEGFEIAHLIPVWVTPQPDSPALLERTFFHPDWYPAIFLTIASSFFFQINWVALGYINFRATSDEEQLPYPLAPVNAEGAVALVESTEEEGARTSWRWRVFSIGAMLGLLFGAVYIVVPSVTSAITGEAFQLLPIPFLDLTPEFGDVIPGAIMALGTNLAVVLAGFYLPYWLIVGQFVGAVFGQVFLNPIIYEAGMLPTYRVGMSTVEAFAANLIDFWLSVTIGANVSIAIIGVGVLIQSFLRTRAQRKRYGKVRGRAFGQTPENRGDMPMWFAWFMFLTSATGATALVYWLVPNFPIWIMAFFAFFFSPFDTYVSSRMKGMAGQDLEFPYMREATFILSGYEGVDIWFVPFPHRDQSWAAERFRELELVGTNFFSVYKLEVLMFPLGMFTSLLFWEFIWRLGPIPSPAYPWAAELWPLRETIRALWATATLAGDSFLLESIKAPVIFYSLGGGLGIYGLIYLLGTPTLFYYGLIAGIVAIPADIYLLMLGGMLSKYYFAKKFGPKTWGRYTPVLAAGFAAGMGLMGMASVAFVFVAKSVIQLPY